MVIRSLRAHIIISPWTLSTVESSRDEIQEKTSGD
jgi:hypothetical protein